MAQNSLELGVKISEQGITQRINKEAVNFMKGIFKKGLEKLRTASKIEIEVLRQFKEIYLADSSVIALPETMKDEFRGCGGNGPQASIKIQLVLSLLTGLMQQIELKEGRASDQGYRGHLRCIEAGSLIITDLGYFVIDSLVSISQNAYFLSRLSTTCSIFSLVQQEIDLHHLLKQAPKKAFEMQIALGKKQRLPCRLICFPLPQEVADRRRQKSKYKAKINKQGVSKRHLDLLGWSLFITNVPPNKLAMAHILPLYALRWQIELFFKLAKSYVGLDHVPALRSERVLFDFYVKLVALQLSTLIVSPFRFWHNREVSAFKVQDIIRRFALEWLRSLDNPSLFFASLERLTQHLFYFGFKQKRKKEPNAFAALDLLCVFFSLPSFSCDFLHVYV